MVEIQHFFSGQHSQCVTDCHSSDASNPYCDKSISIQPPYSHEVLMKFASLMVPAAKQQLCHSFKYSRIAMIPRAPSKSIKEKTTTKSQTGEFSKEMRKFEVTFSLGQLIFLKFSYVCCLLKTNRKSRFVPGEISALVLNYCCFKY